MTSRLSNQRTYPTDIPNADEEKQDAFTSSPTAARVESRHPHEGINISQFAGRLGGGQRFVDDGPLSTTGSRPADAFPDPPWRTLLSLKGFTEPGLWKLAAVEGVGSAFQTFLSGALGHALVPTGTETSVGAVFPVSLASVVQIFLISSFIYCAGSVTGAHFNPLITMGTFCAKLSTLSRTVLYVAFQCLGAVVGAYVLRAGLGVGAKELGPFPGCYTDSSLVSPGSA